MDLSSYARTKTIELTTIGRKSGQPRKVTIWFVVDNEREILVQHANGPVAQWYKNVEANGQVKVNFGDGPVDAVAEPIRDEAGIHAVLKAIKQKYLMAYVIQFMGRNSRKVAARIRF